MSGNRTRSSRCWRDAARAVVEEQLPFYRALLWAEIARVDVDGDAAVGLEAAPCP